MRHMKKRLKNPWVFVPPWLILGALLILMPIFVFWTSQSLHTQKEDMVRVLVEKGAALIRAIEAGTRTGMMGMMGMHGGSFRLQWLLTETAKEPDIFYILVTDVNGTVIAHSDPDNVGSTHGKRLDLQKIAQSDKVQWRQVSNPGGHDNDIFEVFRRFSPSLFPGAGGRGRSVPRSWQRDFPEAAVPDEGIIFVGLEMGPIDAARKEDTRHTLIMASILLLVGSAGIVSLFLAQAYRTTRTSLTRIKAFSDQVVDNMPVGLMTIDAEGKIASFNQAAEMILHFSSREVVGKMASQILPVHLCGLTPGSKNPATTIEKEIDCSLPEGKSIPMDVTISPLQDDEGTFWGHIILFRDLTEVRTLQREIETSRRLASLGKLAAGVAHEIRNPLSSIKGFATYFRERYKAQPEDQKTAEIMIQEVDRLNRVITQLLDFARPLSIEKKRTSLHNLINHTLKMIERQANEKNIRVQKTLPAGIGEVEIDPDRFSQILLNLYLNAIEAMGQSGGILNVTLSREKDPSPAVKVAVSDTGVGIKKEDLEHIFDPYFTTKPSGTGLGLAIVHKIIEAHRGEIRVQSDPGHGTTISLYIPVSQRSDFYP
jgi:two-component system sensor histidine kinase HydH